MLSPILRTITDFTGHSLGQLNEEEPRNQSRLSWGIATVIALIFAFCGAIISLLNMSNLSMDSVGTMLYDLKDPTIGFNQGRKDDDFLKTIHWPRFFSLNKDIHDELSEKLLDLIKKLPFTSDEDIAEFLESIRQAEKSRSAPCKTLEV